MSQHGTGPVGLDELRDIAIPLHPNDVETLIQIGHRTGPDSAFLKLRFWEFLLETDRLTPAACRYLVANLARLDTIT